MLGDYLDRARALREKGEAFVLATVVRAERPTSARPGAKAIVTADARLTGWVGGSCAEPTVIREALKALQDGRPRLVRLCPPELLGKLPSEGVLEVALTCVSGGTLEIYLEPHAPRPHLVAIGHLPVSEALLALGKALGYRVTVISLEGSLDRFAQADAVLNELDFSRLHLAPETYIVVASHGNYDEEALEAALKTDAAYVALVASKKRAEALLHHLRQSGLAEERLSRLKYPAGLDLGAAAPEEIALSILAEIVQLRRRGPARLEIPLQTAGEASEVRDPVCGMMVEVASARYTTSHRGEVYHFCAAACKRAFEKEPEAHLLKK